MSPEQTIDKLPIVNADVASELEKLARMRSARQPADSEIGTASTFGLFEHVIATSVGKIDQAIGELTQLRDHLQNETNRVHGEIAGYAHMTQVALQVALTSAEAITQSLPQFGSGLGLRLNDVAVDCEEQ